jgi:hypothetical protein
MLKGTEPKLTLDGAPTQSRIKEEMGNQKLNNVSKSPYSAKPLPTVGKPVK